MAVCCATVCSCLAAALGRWQFAARRFDLVWRQHKDDGSLLRDGLILCGGNSRKKAVCFFLEAQPRRRLPISGSKQYQSNMQKSARTSNYLLEEDLLACKAFISASTCPITGRDQKETDLTEKMLRYYNEKRDTVKTGERTGQSLLSRFRLISKACLKFQGIFLAVEARQPTGTTREDRVRMAMEEMEAGTGKKFRNVECWEYLSQSQGG
jgi:hypothetical protein